MRFLQVIAITLMALTWTVSLTHAEKRVALVIGNDRYANLAANEQLQKAVNDAHAVGTALRRIGFDVIEGENLGRRAVLARIDEAAQRLAAGDTVFFFFSGHGVAVDGFNYILPADVPAVGSGQFTSLTGAAVKEEDITAAFQRAGARVAIAVLDACRNNPFAASGTKGVGGEKGLAPHEPPSGVFTFYAASRGEAALDRLYDGDDNPNSVFTRVLVPALSRPDLDLPMLAREVREQVTWLARSVNHAQRPAYYDETSGDRIFLAAPPLGTARPAAPAAPASPPQMAIVRPAVPAADPCSGPVTASFPSRCAAPLTAAQERGLKPKDHFKECIDCPEMVVVPAGSFTMGAPKGEQDPYVKEGPEHVVTIGRPFAVGKLHMTRGQFEAFVQKTGYQASSKCSTYNSGNAWFSERADRSWRNPGFAQDGTHPVVCVSGGDAKAYVEWMAKETGRPYRLLSEAEFEYAARGRTSPGTYPRFWFGNDEKDFCRYGNGWDQKAGRGPNPEDDPTRAPGPLPCNDGYERTSPAGNYQPNAFGLYDMTGNASQLTEDCWHDNYDGAPRDGSAWIDQDCHVWKGWTVRGGSWSNVRGTRAAWRRLHWGDAWDNIGFRVARALLP